jgi:hypothetical protein
VISGYARINAASAGIISAPANGSAARSVPRGVSCVCDNSSSAASISAKMRRQRSRNRAPSAVECDAARAAIEKAHADTTYPVLSIQITAQEQDMKAPPK